MARIRSVHPGLFKDENFMDLTEQSPLGCVFLIGLWGQADDKGAFQWKPRTLKAEIFPGISCDVQALLAALVSLNFVKQYEVDGSQYGAIRNFGKFQKPKTPNNIHPMPANFRIYAATDKSIPETGISKVLENVETRIVDEDQCPQNGEKANDGPGAFPQSGEKHPLMEGREENKNNATFFTKKDDQQFLPVPVPATPPPEPKPDHKAEFEIWWKTYPPRRMTDGSLNKSGKAEAMKQFVTARKKATLAELSAAVVQYAKSKDPQFVHDAERWLKRELWADETVTAPATRPTAAKSEMTVY